MLILVYLVTLRKKALLAIAKTFAEESALDGYSEAFKAEPDSRTEEYKNGGKLISEAEANERIKKIIFSRF